MLNKNINKVRRIAKARFGLSIPSGNPYMTTNGLAIPGNTITQQNLLGRDYGAEFRNRAEQIMAPTNDLIDFNAKMGDLFSLKLQNDRNTSRAITQMNTNGITTPKSTSPSLQQSFQRLGGWSTVGQGIDFAGNIIGRDKDGYFGKYGAWQQAGDQLFDYASNTVMTVNPLVGGIMKAGGLASDILTKYAGMGTDSMTKTDAILGSKLLSLTPAGMINGFLVRGLEISLLIKLLPNRQGDLMEVLLEISTGQKKKQGKNMVYLAVKKGSRMINLLMMWSLISLQWRISLKMHQIYPLQLLICLTLIICNMDLISMEVMIRGI